MAHVHIAVLHRVHLAVDSYRVTGYVDIEPDSCVQYLEFAISCLSGRWTAPDRTQTTDGSGSDPIAPLGILGSDVISLACIVTLRHSNSRCGWSVDMTSLIPHGDTSCN